MKKNHIIKTIIGSLLMMVFLIFGLILLPSDAASAYSGDLWDSYEMPSTRQKERLLDAADLLTDSEESELLKRLDTISATHSSNVVILTVKEHAGRIQDFADDYFDYNGFQADYNTSGVLFMLSMEDREWAISTSGSGAQAFTDYGQEYLMDQMMPYLRDGDYYNAFSEYINVADRFFTLYEQGTPYDVNNAKAPKNPLAGAAVSILIGLVSAFAAIAFMAKDLHTVHMNASAAGYQSHSGIKMSVHHDTYVRTTTSRTKLPENDNRSGHSGGSSMHTSSSGSSHGGSHGHF
ncbi:MAG: TPM domain-containing protein [Butyrivibrio sp.]|nr:TPM domain-containing protein [Butyrivibrio sp.]